MQGLAGPGGVGVQLRELAFSGIIISHLAALTWRGLHVQCPLDSPLSMERDRQSWVSVTWKATLGRLH